MARKPPVTIRIPTLEDYALRGGRMPYIGFGPEVGPTIGKFRDRLLGDPANVNKFESYKKGGRVKKTGLAKVHKGERVLTAKQAKTHAKSTPKRAAPRRRRTPR